MNYHIEYLTTDEHFKEAEEIYKSHRKVMRNLYDRSGAVLENTHANNVKFVGCFAEGLLVAFLKLTFWDKLPVYIVGNMNIKKSFLHRYDFTNTQHPIIPVMDFILAEQEKNKKYTWYYNRSLSNGYHKLQLEGKDLLRNCRYGWDATTQQYRYERFIEEVVTAGNLPHYPAYKSLQNKIFDNDYMIVKCCLKNEYRHTLNYFDNKVIEQCLQNTQKIKNT
jgi:hypothetical protein